MFIRNFSPSCFLRNVYGTQPFLDYCQSRDIALSQVLSSPMQKEDLRQWVAALTQLPAEKQAEVELELATVNDMADLGSITQLLNGIQGQDPPSDSIPGNTALALWFFLRHPILFHEVFLHQEVQDTDAWWNAQAPPSADLEDLPAKSTALAARLRELFLLREGTGRFCAVDARRVNGAYCFMAHVADRLQFLEVFTETGEYATQSIRPAMPVIFVYYPLDGTVLVQTRLKSFDRILEFFQLFGQVVLGKELTQSCTEYAFDLEGLKDRFDPLMDQDDMEMVRVKSLHFRYPERYGRRQVKLETLMGDEQFAILQMMQSHMGTEDTRNQVRISYAEIQFRLKVEGGIKNYVIQLWPNRSSLNQTALNERFRACLKLWGLCRANGLKP